MRKSLSLPLEECYHDEDFWQALRRYVRAVVSRRLHAYARQDTYLRPDNLEGPATSKNTPNNLRHVAYHHTPRPEDIEDITQDALVKALENWQEWSTKVTDEFGEETKGIHLARYVARRAIYLHWQALAKLQRAGLLGPDFWLTVPDHRQENDFARVLNRIYWEQVTNQDVHILLTYLARGYGHGEACEMIGISRRTGRRWLNDLAKHLLKQAARY
jgi:DNA-directed RNA polymerase specialized sigma24 family protein